MLGFGQVSESDKIRWDNFIEESTDKELVEFAFSGVAKKLSRYRDMQDSLDNGLLTLTDSEIKHFHSAFDRNERKGSAYYELYSLNTDPQYLNRGTIFQSFLRSVVIVTCMSFTDMSYRKADQICVSFCPSTGESTHSYILEALQEVHFEFNNSYRRIFTDKQLANIFKDSFVLTQYDRKLDDEYNWGSPFKVYNIVKYTRYLLYFLAMVLLYFFVRRYRNKNTI
tara:strand:- start:97 stop:771 length:675 start_codon:yes stop_codon:yes gene_type:complete